MSSDDQSASRREQAREVVDRLAPPGTSGRRALRVGYQVARDGRTYLDHVRAMWSLAGRRSAHDPEYRTWLDQHRPLAQELRLQIRRSVGSAIDVPLEFFVLGPADAPSPRLERSLRSQTYPRWSATSLGSGAQTDPRFRTVATQADLATAIAEGDPRAFLVFLEPGDILEAELAFFVAAHAYDDPSLDLIHWDDDALLRDGRVEEPRFRPEWSPDTLLSANYIGRSFAVRRRRLVEAGGLRPNVDDAGWWDLLLRLDFGAPEVQRVPNVLAHLSRRPQADPEAGAAIVTEHLRTRGWAATAEPGTGGVRVRWELERPPRVTIIIPTRHNRAMLERCLPSLAGTDYPRFDVQIVDNGGQTQERDEWYEEWRRNGLDLNVVWWDEPFNYSAVNNAAARRASGDVLVFLNDDTELADPRWLHEVVGWATRPEIGTVGVQMTNADGLIQHGGVVLGMHGFADHLFAGMRAGDDSMIGHTLWYRDLLAVTAACVAVRRSVFEEVGGFDERFVLCGSDVVLGLDVRHLGLRTVCTPFGHVRHFESVTRGTDVPPGDFFASYWRYQKWLRGGDPYFSPNLSLESSRPRLRRAKEPPPLATVESVLGRNFTVFRQRASEEESYWLADVCRADESFEQASRVRRVRRSDTIQTLSWFVPDIDSPFYGGINTALRMADFLARNHGVENRFVVMAAPNEAFFRSAIEAAFPALGDAPITFIDGPESPEIAKLPTVDAAIATLWVTAYSVARYRGADRGFYLIQDFEPMFYPAGTNYALAEESYRLGLYGLCNSEPLHRIYTNRYGGTAASFVPAVDPTVFHARNRKPVDHDGPATVFVYARPGHWRNCWEIASRALDQLKRRLGDDVRIVTAGSWARPDDLGSGIEHLGLLDYRDTGELYRQCDVGVALTVSAHPSYLPLELLACGVPVIAFDNPAGDWILHDGSNSLRTPLTVDGLSEALIRLSGDGPLRAKLSEQGLADIAAGHADWDRAFSGIYEYLCDPEARA